MAAADAIESQMSHLVEPFPILYPEKPQPQQNHGFPPPARGVINHQSIETQTI